MRDGAAGYWLALLLLCALVAALMSTADSGLMAIAAVVLNDLVGKRPGGRPLTAAQALWLARGVTVGSCVLLVLISTLDVTLVGLAALQQQILCQALPTPIPYPNPNPSPNPNPNPNLNPNLNPRADPKPHH